MKLILTFVPFVVQKKRKNTETQRTQRNTEKKMLNSLLSMPGLKMRKGFPEKKNLNSCLIKLHYGESGFLLSREFDPELVSDHLHSG